MANERLRSLIAASSLSVEDLASRVSVDPKTVERWISTGRTPQRAHRWRVAAELGADEVFLWPSVLDEERSRATSASELVALYPNRGAVPPDLWCGPFEQAAEGVDLLVYSGLFWFDTNPELVEVLRAKGAEGVPVRIVLGDPESASVVERGQEEGTEMPSRIRLTLGLIGPLVGAPGVEVRLHDTTLYASMYRSDGMLLVNTHTYGSPAVQSPVLHLQRVPGGHLVDHYRRSYERVWGGPVRTSEERPVARVDYFDDPNAPTPNSIVPAAVGCLADEHGRLLLEHRVDNDLWALPGGTHDFGESIEQTVVREIREETGLEVEVTGLVGIYSDPRSVIAYSDGEVRQQFTLSFRCRLLGGTLQRDSESQDLRFVAQEELDDLAIHPAMRLRIDHFFENRAEPYLG